MGTIDRTGGQSPALVVDEGAGFVRVRDLRIFRRENRAFCRKWAEHASRGPGVIRARFDLDAATGRLDFRPGALGRDEMARFFADSIYRAIDGPSAPTRRPRTPAVGPKSGHAKDYALAIGSLTMTGVDIVVPGIPTLPFLVASGYYLARTSPKLGRALRSAPFFGPILEEVEEHHALSRRSKRKLVGFTIVDAFGFLTNSPTPVLFVLMVLALAGIQVMPEIGGPASASLAAPSLA